MPVCTLLFLIIDCHYYSLSRSLWSNNTEGHALIVIVSLFKACNIIKMQIAFAMKPFYYTLKLVLE